MTENRNLSENNQQTKNEMLMILQSVINALSAKSAT